MDHTKNKPQNVLIIGPEGNAIPAAMQSIKEYVGFCIGVKHVVHDPQAAIQQIKKMDAGYYDLIILEYDFGEDKKTGMEILEEIRRNNLLHLKTGIIFLTVENFKNRIMGALETFPDGYILKPFTPAKIQEELGGTFRKKTYFSKLYQLIYTKKYEEAIQLANMMLSGKYYKFEALRMKLLVLFYLKDFEAIVLTYNTIQNSENVVKEIKESVWLRFIYVKALYEMGRYPEAIEVSEALKLSNPYFLQNYDLLAEMYHLQEMDDAYINVTKEAIEHSPNPMERWKQFGQITYGLGQLDDAQQAFETLVTNGRMSVYHGVEDYLHLADIHLKNGDLNSIEEVSGKLKTRFQKDKPEETNMVSALINYKVAKAQENTQEAEKYFSEVKNAYQKQNHDEIDSTILQVFGGIAIQEGEHELGNAIIQEAVENARRKDIVIGTITQHLECERTLNTIEMTYNGNFTPENIEEETKKLIQSGDRILAMELTKGVTISHPDDIEPIVYYIILKYMYLEKNLGTQLIAQDEFNNHFIEIKTLEKKYPISTSKKYRLLLAIQEKFSKKCQEIKQQKEMYV